MVDVMQGIDSVARTIQERLSAKTAYGEPVSANGVTIVPVAKVAFGFGGGGGGGRGDAPTNGVSEPVAEHAVHGYGGGGGGGGGAAVRPIGFIEINDIGARWVSIEPPRTETLLSVLTVIMVLLPGRGGRGFIGRLLLLLAGQALVRRLVRPELPMMPADFSMRRATADSVV